MSTLTETCQQLRIYLVFLGCSGVFLFLQRNKQHLKHKLGLGNAPTSSCRSKAMGKGLLSHPGDTQIPGQTPLCERRAGLMPHLWGRREGRNQNPAACSRHVSSSPAHLASAPLVPETWILDSPRAPRRSRAWPFPDAELLQHPFTSRGVRKFCWKRQRSRLPQQRSERRNSVRLGVKVFTETRRSIPCSNRFQQGKGGWRRGKLCRPSWGEVSCRDSC